MKHSLMAAVAVATLAGAGGACADDLPAAVQQAAETKAVELCSVCHGPRGVSTSPEFPILAAQQPGYIELQLHAFKEKRRAEPDAHDYMWGIAGGLDDTMIKGVAAYFSKQPAAPARTGDAATIARGKALYETGLPDRGVPACATCHGKDAQTLVRAAPVMHGIVKDMTPPEIDAVAAYVQSL
jgi:cytochrome c553